MAEEEFQTLDDEDLEEVKQEVEIEEDLNSKEKNKSDKIIKLIIIALLTLILIMLIVFTFIYIQKKSQKSQSHEVNATEIIKTVQDKELSPKQMTRAQKLIHKADKLYSKGKIKEAILIYSELSVYNKAISFYNIGVAKLKERKYKEAIKSFENSMQSNKLKCASALNAAIASLYLNDMDSFDYYLLIAEKYLHYMVNFPLYSYYQGLINYYKNEPVESLLTTLNPSSNFYKDKQNFLAAKILAAQKNDSLAINHLKKIGDPKNTLSIGLLQARAGEYSLSADSLQNAVSRNFQPLKSNIALALVKNKLGLLEDSGNLLKAAYDAFQDEAENTYPISVKLKESLFNPVHAQKEFKNRLFLNDKYKYSLLFYYAPYQVFNSEQTINFITKGAKKVEIEQIKPALSYLQDSKAISNINIAITKALKKIVDNKVYEANVIFKNAITIYPAHATLHYNLALSYAQIFDFQNAYKHFSRSYSLDNHNYHALAFKTFCARVTNRDIPRKELEKLKAKSSDKEALALIEIAINSLGLNLGYLDAKNSIFKHSINLIFAYGRNDITFYKKSALWLKNNLKNDIVSNILYLDASNDKDEIKTYARAIQTQLNQKTLNLSPLYFGGSFARELYVRTLSIAGLAPLSRLQLNEYAKNNKPTIPLLQSLAFANIYNKNFENSYKIYNELIDTYKQKDSHTLFLASVAAIGAGHNANAVALLELAKLTDSSNFESRYALGLLYQEAKNFEGSSIQYKKIGNSGFKSDFFTFYLKK